MAHAPHRLSPSVEKGTLLFEHAAILAFYGVLSLAISWPLARDFTTVLIGPGLDALGHLWGIWHTAQAVVGREPFFSTTLLYYPAGISLLLHSAGPLPGILALPFWILGPIAAYNGGLLVGLVLTGYGMYLLARDLGCSRGAALFAGTVLVGAPAHLVGLRGHLEKVFLGLMPLAFLTLRRSVDLDRSLVWSAAFGLSLLLLLLHSPFQFVQVALASPLIVAAMTLRSADRRAVGVRTACAILAAAVIAGPLLAAITRAASDPAMLIDRSVESVSHQPDLTQVVLPSSFSRVFGTWSTTLLSSWNVAPEIETEVSIPWTALALCLAALVLRPRAAAVWLIVAGCAVLLSLGPTLHAFGQRTGAPLPYAWITALPGLDFLRTPARFMQLAFVGIAAAAAIGLAGVERHLRGVPIVAVAMLTLLVEVWPVPWAGQPLPSAPPLYEELARDRDAYGILDLPVRPIPDFSPIDYSAKYQVLQMTHRKGIAGGYLSRTYERHPVSPCVWSTERAPLDIRVNGRVSNCEPAAVHQLASRGYRWVVWHQPSETTSDNLPGSWAAEDATLFVAVAFSGRGPDLSDRWIRAWRLPPPEQSLPTEPVIELGTGWYPAEPAWRWAQSPATLSITSPRAQPAELVLSVALLHGLGTPVGLGQEGVLLVTVGDEAVSRAVKPGESVRVPLTVRRGATAVSISLGAGNFRPTDYGQDDARALSVAFTSIELVTPPKPPSSP